MKNCIDHKSFFKIEHLTFVSERLRRLCSTALRKEAVITARQVVDFPNGFFFHIFWVMRVIAELTERTAKVFVDLPIQTQGEGHTKYLKFQLGLVFVT